MLKDQIISYCHSLGLTAVGMITCRSLDELIPFYEMRKEKGLENEFEEHDLYKRIHPSHYMPSAKTILSIAFPYLHQEVEAVDNGFSIYTKRLDYHKVVQSYLQAICEYIQTLGGEAMGFVDSNTLPERYLAYLAGVGFIGRNNMVITKAYGSYVFLGEILMDLDIKGLEEHGKLGDIKSYEACGECMICISDCPTKAINQKQCNPNICLSYLTQKKTLTDREIKLLKGNVFGCDACQLGCPYNQQVAMNVLPEFEALEGMNLPVSAYASMDNAFFKAEVGRSSCGWRGKNVIKRNALLNLAKLGVPIESLRSESPYLNEYIDRLTNFEK